MSNRKRMPNIVGVDTADLETTKVGKYIGVDRNYEGRPFTGFGIDGYYDNDQIVGETQYVNGEQIGWELRYYDNGQLERETLSLGATTVFFQEFDRGKK